MSDKDTEKYNAVSGALDDVLGQVLDARSAIDDGHTLDLTGMDESVELVCRAAGTLPREDGQKLAPNLARLVHALDELGEAVKRAQNGLDDTAGRH